MPLFYFGIYLLRRDRGGLLKDIKKDNVFRSVHELDEYISENQIIFEYEAYTVLCWNLASILSFEGYDLI